MKQKNKRKKQFNDWKFLIWFKILSQNDNWLVLVIIRKEEDLNMVTAVHEK